MIFTAPIKFFVSSLDEPILFDSSDKLIEWISSQSGEWNYFASKVKSASDLIPNASTYITQNINNWTSFSGSIASYAASDDEASIKSLEVQIQGLLQQGQMIWTGDSLASRAIAISDSDATSAVWVFLLATGFSGQVLMSYGNQASWASFAKALLFLVDPKTSSSFHTKQAAAIRSIEKTISAANSELSKFQKTAIHAQDEYSSINKKYASDFDELKSDFIAQAESQRKSVDDEWSKLRSAYDYQLKLKAPIDYWRGKFASHKDLSGSWRYAFFGMIAFASLLLFFSVNAFTMEWIKIPKNMGGYAWVVPAVVIGVPAFISLWLLRFFGRQWSEHLGRAEDARERIVMIETFLALSRDTDSPGAISDPAQLALVLSSIFRPASSSANDDSPPAGFFEAILTNMTRTSGPK